MELLMVFTWIVVVMIFAVCVYIAETVGDIKTMLSELLTDDTEDEEE